MLTDHATTADLELIYRQKLADAGCWRKVDALEYYPANDDTVVALLVGQEYEIDRAKLERLVSQGHFQPPRTIGGKRRWEAGDIINLIALLEVRRDWRAFSAIHAAKKTPYHRGREEAEFNGDVHRFVEDIDRFDLRHLLILSAQADNRSLREQLLETIIAKLHGEGLTL